jgi:hypothetical protein
VQLSVETPQLRRRLKNIAFGALIAVLLPAIVFLLPIILPVAFAADAWEIRRLARTRCIVCGKPVGLSEVRRASEAARAKGMAMARALMRSHRIPRVVVDWEVSCPTCGQAYVCPQSGRRRELVPK